MDALPVEEVEVVLAHQERAVVRVGDTFLKIDPNTERVERELRAMGHADVPTPEVRWRRPHVTALAKVPGRSLGSFGRPSIQDPALWRATGAAVRRIHETPPLAGVGEVRMFVEGVGAFVEDAAKWLRDNEVVPADAIRVAIEVCRRTDRPYMATFVHGDLQPAHVFVDGGAVTGVIDWSDAATFDPLFDLAVVTLDDGDRLDDVLDGYGIDVDRGVIEGWRAVRRLGAVRWLVEHGYDARPVVEQLTAARGTRE